MSLPIRYNILKCEIMYDNKKYNATLQLCLATIYSTSFDSSHLSDYSNRIYLKNNCGFQYVIYENDGTRPQYNDANPFEFINEMG